MSIKKLLAVVASVAIVIPTFSFSAGAANGDIIEVGGKQVKLITDFNHFKKDMRVGQDESCEAFSCGSNTDDFGMDVRIAEGKGVDGNCIKSGAQDDGIDEKKGCYYNIVYHVLGDENPVENYEGATDFVFWMDATKETEDHVGTQIVISECDYDDAGNQIITKDKLTGNDVAAVTNRLLADDPECKYYLLRDGKWEEKAGTSGCYCNIPSDFKGYVRIPLENFDPVWGTKDKNGKWDLKKVVDVQFFHGMWSRHEGEEAAFYLDNIGFAGDFEKPTEEPTTDKTDDTTATPDTTKDVPSDTTTTTTAKKSDNPKTGNAPITAAVVTAVVFAGVAVASKKRMK